MCERAGESGSYETFGQKTRSLFQTFESNQLVVAFLPQVHLSLVFTQQLLVGAAHLTDHLADLTHTHTLYIYKITAKSFV